MNQNRAKLMSRLKILSSSTSPSGAGSRRSFRARLARDGQTTVDFGISIIPGYGESAVIRILDPAGCRSRGGLGLRAPVTIRMRQLLRSSTGIILVTGPTAPARAPASVRSRASTSRASRSSRPRTDRVCLRQLPPAQVDERLGNTFATFLRSFLRHDRT
jgi:type II secretory ATPase GspE/PulE/Tfp pilus assembly ATPase PilB-like protein